MILVDTNLLAYLLLPTPHTAKAEAVLIKDSDWFAPQLIHSEFRNVLLGAVRRDDIARSDADSFLARAQEVITVPEAAIDGPAVFDLAIESGCSAYDCEFVWLARYLRIPLVTADKKMLHAFPGQAVAIEQFLGTSTP
jgi:predicted nucleic acid-binding protein